MNTILHTIRKLFLVPVQASQNFFLQPSGSFWPYGAIISRYFKHLHLQHMLPSSQKPWPKQSNESTVFGQSGACASAVPFLPLAFWAALSVPGDAGSLQPSTETVRGSFTLNSKGKQFGNTWIHQPGSIISNGLPSLCNVLPGSPFKSC